MRLIMGTSMGCMHSFLWGEIYPAFAKALMPLACEPIEIAGLNRMWRQMIIDGIEGDPAWDGGNYTKQPLQGLRTAEDILFIAGAAPLSLQAQCIRPATQRSLTCASAPPTFPASRRTT
jgi:homoserine O-acetyltransferase